MAGRQGETDIGIRSAALPLSEFFTHFGANFCSMSESFTVSDPIASRFV
jgi:hypothetical protein